MSEEVKMLSNKNYKEDLKMGNINNTSKGNSEKVPESTKTGVNFCSLLAILFIGLKLTNNIDWSWVWVLSPLWIPVAIIITIFIGGFLMIGCGSFLESYNKVKKK